MHIPDYRYPIEQCSVPEVRRPQLKSYRDFRRECLERLQGDADTSVRNQILDLTWHTAVFRTLNEARRLEPSRSVNGAMWELTTAGYANLITLGIRRLVDTNPKADSAWSVLERIARRPELLTRELFVAHDGLPYDYEKVLEAHLKTRTVGVQYLSTVGPDAFDTSQRMHEDFDAVCGRPSKRKRLDRIDTGIFDVLRAQLKHPVIEKVCTMVDKTVAHAERIDPKGPAVPIATFNDVDEALGRIVRVCQFISWNLLAEGGFSSVNRQVVNVLTALRSYVDQAPQLFKALDLKPDYASSVKKALNDMHAASADYRFVYALRNYVQHQGSAVQGFEGADRLKVDANGWASAVRLLAFEDQLGTADFKANLLAEQPHKIDIRQRLRMSMEALGTVHLALRERVAPNVGAARAAFEAAIRDYRAAEPPGIVALYARAEANPDRNVLIILDWDDVRLGLVRKNCQPARLWPKRSIGQPDPAVIVALRTGAGHSLRQAAEAVNASEEQWMDWEAGLPMPEGLFILYQLQTNQHPTHRVERKQ